MATLVLGALGTLVGGPIGGAIGALAGRQIDAQILGSGNREGPRLKELAVSTSSYGAPIPRLFGTMRVPGTVVWATDLTEHRESSGGGKGRPGTTTYSYSASFAVVLASRPLVRLGRIWADGNLLRGAAGDLKTAGTLRFHSGHGDARPDPLLAAAIGPDCPALRGRAYVVFEDLQLADFGNRIPALTFEAIADDGTLDLAMLTAPLAPEVAAAVPLAGLTGLSDEGDGLASLLAMIDQLYPLAVRDTAGTVQITPAAFTSDAPTMLAEPVRRSDSEDPDDNGRSQVLAPVRDSGSLALRYYDTARDYQPGLQRSPGRAAIEGETVTDFAAALAAGDAASLIAARAAREQEGRKSLHWRVGGIDPGWGAGAVVRTPGEAGLWRVAAWEWRESGVELDLIRVFDQPAGPAAGASGTVVPPVDFLPPPTLLRAFELPFDGDSGAGSQARFAAVASTGPQWRGAALYREEAGTLLPIGTAPRRQATAGTLASPVAGSPALVVERAAALEVVTASSAMGFADATLAALAQGANRLLVGEEIIQFAVARQVGEMLWHLSALLRGRGGTEAGAIAGHPAGTAVTLLDDALMALDGLTASTTRIAAIGAGDDEPVFAFVEGLGAGGRPLVPVHPRHSIAADGSLTASWTRRARGGWRWLDGVETPLNEEAERYLVGIGNPDSPLAAWDVAEPRITLAASALAGLAGEPVWVSQSGRLARSYPLLLARL